MPKTVDAAASILVLGSTGSFGAAVGLELLSRGLSVTLFARDLDRVRRRFGNRANATYLIGDATDDAAVTNAITGCRAMVVGLNLTPDNAASTLVRLIDRFAASRGTPASESSNTSDEDSDVEPSRPATASRSRIIIVPATPTDAKQWCADQSLAAACQQSGISLVFIATGPLFGPTVRNWAIDSICRSALDWKTIRSLTILDSPTHWTYAPDVARAAADILQSTSATDSRGRMRSVVVPPIDTTERAFLTELGTGAIRLSLPPGTTIESLNGRATPQVGTHSGWQLKLARLANSSAAESIDFVLRATDTAIAPHDHSILATDRPRPTASEPAVRMTIASYLQGG